MSAFICSDVQVIKAVLGWAKHTAQTRLTPDNLVEKMNILMRENVRSVNWRYGERTRHKKIKVVVPYMDAYVPEPIEQIVQWLRCLDYNSCERPDYERSKAYTLNMKMQQALLMTMVGRRRFDSTKWTV